MKKISLYKKLIIFFIVSFKLILYIIQKTITMNSLINKLFLIFIIILSLPYILKLRFNKESFIKIVLFFLLATYLFLINNDDNIFLFSLLGLLLIDNDNKDIIKTIFISLTIGFVFTLILGKVGILYNNKLIRSTDGVLQNRYSLGFSNPNAVFAYFIPIIISGAYLYKNNILFILIFLISAIILYYYTKCRTGFYIIIIILIFSLLKLRIGKKGNIFFPVFSILSILLAILFGKTHYNIINQALSYRPWFSYQFLSKGFSAWGKGIPEDLIIDNFYLRILAFYSIIGFLVYYYIYYKGSLKCKNDYLLIHSLFFFLLYNVFEAMTIGNFVLIIFLKEIFISYGVYYEKN